MPASASHLYHGHSAGSLYIRCRCPKSMTWRSLPGAYVCLQDRAPTGELQIAEGTSIKRLGGGGSPLSRLPSLRLTPSSPRQCHRLWAVSAVALCGICLRLRLFARAAAASLALPAELTLRRRQRQRRPPTNTSVCRVAARGFRDASRACSRFLDPAAAAADGRSIPRIVPGLGSGLGGPRIATGSRGHLAQALLVPMRVALIARCWSAPDSTLRLERWAWSTAYAPLFVLCSASTRAQWSVGAALCLPSQGLDAARQAANQRRAWKILADLLDRRRMTLHAGR
ncbi:hypothetical protein EVG20_g5755 [Dentipellis fragilis]|uniref:Uncharacterized protein n=1 Tax=Dentipellis fragilis TaxID=205917 RepID=A0A4Y9YS43_9AGAM|nr:hypothetical protein EVG20_g5755 [Dentipellis fragilis]